MRFKMLLKKIQVGQFDRKNVIRKYSFVKPIKGQEMLFEWILSGVQYTIIPVLPYLNTLLLFIGSWV